MILVSGCLVGKNCKYNGGNNRNEDVLRYLEGKNYQIICPEVMGGLKIPHPPAEIQNDHVVNAEREDVTEFFQRGAEKVLSVAQQENAELCILKENSPSCGVHCIYNGTFSGKKIPGMGVTARLLHDHGFALLSEKDLKDS